MSVQHLLAGWRGERLAARHLRRSGLQVLARNLKTPGGEIDLLCVGSGRAPPGAPGPGPPVLVFVEVRAVASPGGPERAADAVTPAKARQVARAALSWLGGRGPRRILGRRAAAALGEGAAVRFDVVGVDLRTGHVEHVADAFTPEDWRR